MSPTATIVIGTEEGGPGVDSGGVSSGPLGASASAESTGSGLSGEGGTGGAALHASTAHAANAIPASRPINDSTSGDRRDPFILQELRARATML